MAKRTTYTEVELKIPLTENAQPVFSKIRVSVPEELAKDTTVISEDLDGNPIEVKLTLESEFTEYIFEPDKLETTLEEIRTVANGLLPEGLSVTDFANIGIAHAILAQEFLKEKDEEAEVTYLAVWDDITKVDAPIVKRASDPTSESDFPSTELPPESEPDLDPEEEPVQGTPLSTEPETEVTE